MTASHRVDYTTASRAPTKVRFKRRSSQRGTTTRSYPHRFYLPAAAVFGLMFVAPTEIRVLNSAISLFYAFTRWTLFQWERIGLDNFRQFLPRAAVTNGLRNTLVYAVVTSGQKVMIDGCSGLRQLWKVVFPLLRPFVITVIVTSSVIIYYDFQNPLYFLPGQHNTTVQLTLYNFQGQFNTQWNLLFMDVLLITIPPLVMFMFFNRKIVAGLTAGAIKG